MAVPKCKVSKARRDKRRSSHWKISVLDRRIPFTGGEEGAAFLLVFL